MKKGSHQSEETKRKISEANTGKWSVWKGKHLSEETRKKISFSLLGHLSWNKGLDWQPKSAFKKGHIPWNKDKGSVIHSEYARAHRNRIWRRLRLKILERDKYICRKCSLIANTVDFIIPWRIAKTYSEKNLQALCRSCNSKKVFEDKQSFNL